MQDDTQLRRKLTADEIFKKPSMVMNFEEYAKREEIAPGLRSRDLWLKLGYKNNKFFQRIANAHKKNNYVDKLVVGGECIEELENIKREIAHFYHNLYSRGIETM